MIEIAYTGFMEIIVNQILIMAILIVVGYGLCKSHFIDDQVTKGISNVLLRFVIPVTIMESFNQAFSVEKLKQILFVSFLSVVFTLLTIMIAKMFFKDDERIEQYAVIFTNKGFVGIPIIAAADGPTAIFVANKLAPELLGSITVAAYSYMALVPIIQPVAIKLVTTKKERQIRMSYKAEGVSQKTKILFPIVIIVVAGLIAPVSLPLVGFLMFGNLMRECGVLDRLSQTAQNELVNLVSILLGFTIALKMTAAEFLTIETLMVIAFGLVGFVMDTIGGVLFVKLLNIFRKEKMNPMIGAAGISAFPMSARVVQRLASEEDKQNFVLNYSIGANVSGQIASVIAGGLLLAYFL